MHAWGEGEKRPGDMASCSFCFKLGCGVLCRDGTEDKAAVEHGLGLGWYYGFLSLQALPAPQSGMKRSTWGQAESALPRAWGGSWPPNRGVSNTA